MCLATFNAVASENASRSSGQAAVSAPSSLESLSAAGEDHAESPDTDTDSTSETAADSDSSDDGADTAA